MKHPHTLLALTCLFFCSVLASCSHDDTDIPSIDDYEYISIVLDEPSIAILRDYAKVHNPWNASDKITYSCDHMTVFHADEVDRTGAWDWCVKHRGETFELRATTVGYSDHCFAIRITTDIPVFSGIPHITLTVNNTNGGEAWESRLIKNWTPLDKEIILRGTVTFHQKR